MDLRLPGETRPSAGQPRDGERVTHTCPGGSPDNNEGFRDVAQSSLTKPPDGRWPWASRRRLTMVVGVLCTGLLLLFGLARNKGTSGGPEITVRIPPAEQSIAVVQALP